MDVDSKTLIRTCKDDSLWFAMASYVIKFLIEKSDQVTKEYVALGKDTGKWNVNSVFFLMYAIEV